MLTWINYNQKLLTFLSRRLRLPWLPFQDGRHRIFGNMVAKIYQKPLKHVLPNFALMLFNLLHGDLFKSPFFACPIKILKKWEQKIFLISVSFRFAFFMRFVFSFKLSFISYPFYHKREG